MCTNPKYMMICYMSLRYSMTFRYSYIVSKEDLKFEGLSGNQATYSIKTNLETLVLLLLQKCEENICQIKKQIFQFP